MRRCLGLLLRMCLRIDACYRRSMHIGWYGPMSATMNWPDPDRPGYPMFPERDGWHLIVDGGQCACYWHHGKELWWNENKRVYMAIDDITKQTCCIEYIGPVRTPAQIAEMLARERERCLLAFVAHRERAELAYNGSTSDEEKQYWRGALNTFEECRDEIRSLGDVGQ